MWRPESSKPLESAADSRKAPGRSRPLEQFRGLCASVDARPVEANGPITGIAGGFRPEYRPRVTERSVRAVLGRRTRAPPTLRRRVPAGRPTPRAIRAEATRKRPEMQSTSGSRLLAQCSLHWQSSPSGWGKEIEPRPIGRRDHRPLVRRLLALPAGPSRRRRVSRPRLRQHRRRVRLRLPNMVRLVQPDLPRDPLHFGRPLAAKALSFLGWWGYGPTLPSTTMLVLSFTTIGATGLPGDAEHWIFGSS